MTQQTETPVTLLISLGIDSDQHSLSSCRRASTPAHCSDNTATLLDCSLLSPLAAAWAFPRRCYATADCRPPTTDHLPPPMGLVGAEGPRPVPDLQKVWPAGPQLGQRHAGGIRCSGIGDTPRPSTTPVRCLDGDVSCVDWRPLLLDGAILPKCDNCLERHHRLNSLVGARGGTRR